MGQEEKSQNVSGVGGNVDIAKKKEKEDTLDVPHKSS